MGITPAAIIQRQVPPRGSYADNPEYPIDKPTIVFGDTGPNYPYVLEVAVQKIPHTCSEISRRLCAGWFMARPLCRKL